MQTDAAFQSVLDRFVEIVGPAHALRDEADITPYVTERRGRYGGTSPLVLRPADTAEVSRILRLATETGTAIVPQGGNTGLVGGGTPDTTGRQVVVSLSRLNRIREVDAVANTITAEAGVVLHTLHDAAEKADRLFPLSLASQGSCEIGGNLSTNAGGTAVLAYGNARELCLGVEVVLPTGEILDDLRKLKKDNTGYDLKNLFVGAEGTLGIITAAVLKLFPRPRGREVAMAGLASTQQALRLFQRAEQMGGSALTAFELIARTPMEFVLRHQPGARQPFADSWPWYVLVEISSSRSAEDARGRMEAILAAALEADEVGDAVIAESMAGQQALWGLREGLSDSQRPEGASIKHDISVPISTIPAFINQAAGVVEGVCPGARVACFGHMGDGNLHYNVSRPLDWTDEAFLDLYPPMNEAVHALVRSMGGSISAEHGIGRMKRDELSRTAPPVALDLMRRIKTSFDPAGIMNPGKVV
jgi:FAD/FMN-containing dehydrogenase